jgi:hypothetical protein
MLLVLLCQVHFFEIIIHHQIDQVCLIFLKRRNLSRKDISVNYKMLVDWCKQLNNNNPLLKHGSQLGKATMYFRSFSRELTLQESHQMKDPRGRLTLTLVSLGKNLEVLPLIPVFRKAKDLSHLVEEVMMVINAVGVLYALWGKLDAPFCHLY